MIRRDLAITAVIEDSACDVDDRCLCPPYISLICCWISGFRIKAASSFQLPSASVGAQLLYVILRLHFTVEEDFP